MAITTPPGRATRSPANASQAGLHCLLEKPPTAGLAEIAELDCLAQAQGRDAVHDLARAASRGRRRGGARRSPASASSRMEIHWHEDVHKWHPGQQWIWEPGGFGVFDPGINAFSIATKIFPGALFVQSAELSVPRECADADRRRHRVLKPAGRRPADTPASTGGAARARNGRSPSRPRDGTDGPPRRRRREADRSTASAQADDGIGEYPDIYREFVDLIDERRSQVDVAPLRLVADCLLRRTARRRADPRLMEQLRLTRLDRHRAACVTTIVRAAGSGR